MSSRPTAARRPVAGGAPAVRSHAAAVLLAAAWALAGPHAAAAAPPLIPAPATEETVAVPSFAIESIRVEGVRPRSEAVVVAASLLEPGGTYSERELRDAVSRIVRLPFVLAADFALERGSEPGDHVLVIRAVATRRFFFATDYRYTSFDRPVSLSAPGSRDSQFALLAAGYRQPLGLYGEAFVALDTEQGAQVGLAHYNLFGRRASGSVAYSDNELCCPRALFPLMLDPGFGEWSLSGSEQAAARLVVPLGGNHGLRFTAETLRSDNASRNDVLPPVLFGAFADVPSFEHRRAEVAWVYDDSDDPLAPRNGRTWTAGFEYQDLDGRSAFFDLATGSLLEPVAFRSEMVRAVVSGAVHHPMTARQSVSVAGRLAAGRSRVDALPAGTGRLPAKDLDGAEASLAATHRLTLWQPPEQFARLWLETEAGYAYEEVSPAPAGAVSSLGQGRVGLSLVFRNAWGLFRVGVAWVDLEESRR
jgi:hypothetical protein